MWAQPLHDGGEGDDRARRQQTASQLRLLHGFEALLGFRRPRPEASHLCNRAAVILRDDSSTSRSLTLQHTFNKLSTHSRRSPPSRPKNRPPPTAKPPAPEPPVGASAPRPCGPPAHPRDFLHAVRRAVVQTSPHFRRLCKRQIGHAGKNSESCKRPRQSPPGARTSWRCPAGTRASKHRGRASSRIRSDRHRSRQDGGKAEAAVTGGVALRLPHTWPRAWTPRHSVQLPARGDFSVVSLTQ